MTGTIRELMNDALAASFNPSDTYRAAIRTQIAVMDGRIENISPMSPFVSAIENQAALIAAFVESVDAQTRRILQVNALTKEDLYPHMADIHFTNIFNLPAKTTFSLVFDKRELLLAMSPIPGTLSKKVTIGRDTYFRISDHTYGIHYPIDIVQQLHGAIQVTYDTSKTSKLQSLRTNQLTTREATNEGVTYLVIDVPVHQFVITSKTPTVTLGSTFNYKVGITDLYYATRVYRTLENGTEEEIRVSYSEEIYDPLTPTAVVTMTDSEVNVMVPQIYINSGLIMGELRIDVYTTAGPLDTRYDSYPMGSIVHRFRNLSKRAVATYTAPMNKLSTVMVLGESPVNGGALALTFDELRTAVIADAIGDPNLPITPAQIQNYLSRMGYDIIKNTDIVTDRVFLASRDMPAPENSALVTAANTSIETLTTSFVDLAMNSSVIDNGRSMTITPKAVYRLDDSVLKMLTDAELASVRAMRTDLLAVHVTKSNYLYSPYHYVLDKTGDQFRLAAYSMEAPKVVSQSFIDDNPTTLLSVGTNGYSLTKNDSGYLLRITTKSSDEYKALESADVQALLSFTSPTEENDAWLVGTNVGITSDKERVFEFQLDSRFSMNEFDRVDMRSFKMFDLTDRAVYADLEQLFNIHYTTTLAMGIGFEPSLMDKKLPRFLVPQEMVTITKEQLGLHFGDALSNLWSRARTIAAAVTYDTYPTDVLQRYTEDIYAKDPVTGSDITWVDGLPVRVKTHSKGDLVLDAQGNSFVQYPKGTVRLDPVTGLPVEKGARYLKHRIELFLIEGVYFFSNDSVAIDYRNSVAQTVTTWVTDDLTAIEAVTMDKSRAYFYPKTVFGSIDVVTADGIIQQISAGQRFTVSLTVAKEVMSNDKLKAQLSKITIDTIALGLNNTTLAISDIIRELKVVYGDDVIDVQMNLFGTLEDIPAMQLTNEVRRCGIRKRLVSRDDGKLIVEEDITTTFSTL